MTRSEELLGRSSPPDNGKSGLIFGLSLRQGVVLIVLAYTAITALLLGRAYRNRSIIVTHNSGLFINIQDRTVSNVLSGDTLDSDEQPRVLDDANISSLEFRVEAVVEDEIQAGENDVENDVRDSLYHSSVVFGLNYEEMLSSFKVYVYPITDHTFKPLSDSIEGDEALFTDELFFKTLYQSDFVTDEPEKAHIYFIPVSFRALWDDERLGPGKIGRFMNKYIQSLRDAFPYWQRTLGADHAIVVCHDYKEDGSRNGLELKKNVIQVACSPLAGDQAFYPHKDFSIPSYQGVNEPTPPHDDERERSKLVYHYGVDSSDFNSMWEGQSEFVTETEDVAPDVHHKHLTSSKFCLIVIPEDSANIVDALRAGCVPILISDGRMYDLPFQDVLNWNQFSVVLSVNKLKKLKKILQNFSDEQYKHMQLLAKEASKHMEWHSPPLDQDAFYMTLYDLWVRRHAIRYVQREDL